MDIWRFQSGLTRRLLAWAALSAALGGVMLLRRRPFWGGMGAQFAGWGLVNAAIATFGSRAADRRRAALPDPADPAVHSRESAGLERLLWINSGLDAGYIAGGLALAQTRGRSDRRSAGHGWGVVLQGAFLLLFDVIHAVELRQRSG